MSALVLVGAALPVAATYALLTPARHAGVTRLCSAALAIGIGLGIASCTFFLALVLFDGRRAGVIAIDAILATLALAVWRRSAARRASPRVPLSFSSAERVLAVAAIVAAAAAATSFFANTLDAPHGRWDAWATWNLRARWLANAGAQWRAAFLKPTIHGDYPLLLPSTVARLWVYAGDNDPLVPAVVAAAYGAALVLLLYAALAAVRGRAQGLIGALCLLGTPLFLRTAPWQYADVPLAFNLLGAVSLLSLHDRDPACGRPMLLWAGVATGLAAWTKNEGMVLALGIVAVRGAMMVARRTPGLHSAASFAAGLLLPAAIMLYFKVRLAPRSPQFGQPVGTMTQLLLDPGRYGVVLRAAGDELVRGTGPVLLALAVYAILLGRTGDERARALAARALAILGFAALGYAFQYIVARAELMWLLSHSADRLVMQLWPTIVFALLLYVASPLEREATAQRGAASDRPPTKPARRRRRAVRR